MASAGKPTLQPIELQTLNTNKQSNGSSEEETEPMLNRPTPISGPTPRPRAPSNSNILSSSSQSRKSFEATENQPAIISSKSIPQVELAYTGDITGDTTQQTFNFSGPQVPAMGEIDEQPSPTGLLGWLGFGCSVFALACLCVSFASPYWMQTYPMSFNTFQNMGLWEVCMADYMHHKDDTQTIYDGCWWVFDRAEKYTKLKEWLLPPWFITCQVMVTMNLICHFATIGIVAMIYLHCCPIINHEYHQSYAMFAASGLCFFITILTIITGVMYGVFCGDRQWMPRPDLNFISWGYGFLIIQGIISTGAGVCYFMEAQKAFNELDRRDQEYTKAVLDMEMTQPPNYSYGAPSYGQPSYDAGSNYGQDYSLPEKQSYTSQPSYDPRSQSYSSQPSYDPRSQSYSSQPPGGQSYSDKGSSYEKGGSYSEKPGAYSEKPPYPAYS